MFVNQVVNCDKSGLSTTKEAIITELNEKLLVELSYTIVDPGAMMVHLHDASFAHRTMVHSRSSHYIAFVTPFQLDFELGAEFFHILISN